MFCFNVDIQTFRYSFHNLVRVQTFFRGVIVMPIALWTYVGLALFRPNTWLEFQISGQNWNV